MALRDWIWGLFGVLGGLSETVFSGGGEYLCVGNWTVAGSF